MESPTFRSLCAEAGYPISTHLPTVWPLEKWFAAICDLPIAAFPVEDLARACRQNMFPEAVVPYCLTVLAKEPLAGELYDGELLTALLGLPPEFWQAASSETRQAALSVAKAAFEITDDEKLMTDIVHFVTVFDNR